MNKFRIEMEKWKASYEEKKKNIIGEEYIDEYGKYFGEMEGGKPSGIGS